MTTPKPDDPGAPRDPRLDAAWRAASHEEPPVALDAAILAAARREVGARPQSLGARAAMRAGRRWWPLAAAATIAAVAIGVVQRVTHEDLGAPAGSAVVSDMPTQAAKPAMETARSTAETVTPRPREDGVAALPEPLPAASPKLDAAIAPGAVPAAPPSVSGGIAASAPRPAPMAKTAAAPAESQRNEAEGRSKDRAPLPIPDWIALIRRLRAEGNTADAGRELAAFRAAHADHEKLLPPDLRDWRPAEK